MQEMNCAAEGRSGLCPRLLFRSGGFLVVMPRAQPMTDAQCCPFDCQAFITRGELRRIGGQSRKRGPSASQFSKLCLETRSLIPAMRRQNTSGTVLAC